MQMPSPSADAGTAPGPDASTPSACDDFIEGEDPGFLNLRRLNHAEYDNSVSAIIGTDLKPSVNFPADEIALGFDNIAIVQSLSPLHFETHHDAVRKIVDETLKMPPANLDLHFEAEDLIDHNPNGGRSGGAQGDVYRMMGMTTLPSPEQYEFKPGNYRVQFRAYSLVESMLAPATVTVKFGSQASSAPIPVLASESAPQIYEVTVPVDAEVGKFILQFPNGFSNQNGFPPLYTTPTQCTVDNTMDDDCKMAFGPDTFCVKESCRHRMACSSDSQCVAAGIGDRCGNHNSCNVEGIGTCCLDSSFQRRWLYVDWVAIEELNETGPANQIRNALLDCGNMAPGSKACARKIFSDLGLKAWRRPLNSSELDRLVAFVDQVAAEGDTFDAALDLGLGAIFTSPNFIFRVEIDENPDSEDAHALSNYELATRLSYFLWSGPPDDTLLQLAKQGVLNTDEVLAAQLTRMLADPRASQLHTNFGEQWLHIRSIDTVQPNTTLFPDFDEELRAAIKTEAKLFFASFQEDNRDLREVLTSNETFLNDDLAAHYGLPAVGSNTHQRVSTEGTNRRGYLTQAGLLTLTSGPDHTSVVSRGKWVLEQLLCQPPPPPPANVEGFTEAVDPNASLKEQMAQHRTDPTCAACHAQMDPIGFTFENFGPTGKWREQDEHNNAIDATGELPDGRFLDGVSGLVDVLADDPKVTSCMTQNMLTYAVGRSFRWEPCAVGDVTTKWGKEDFKFKSLIRKIVMSPLFRARRGQMCGG